jgi:Fe2+ transport system protein FeoA
VSQAVFPRIVHLTDLDTGATARLLHVDVDPESRSLLRGLGLTEGSTLRVCQRGEPCIIQVRSTRIGISSRVARHVVVRPESELAPDQRKP